jgi:hypothetical protein
MLQFLGNTIPDETSEGQNLVEAFATDGTFAILLRYLVQLLKEAISRKNQLLHAHLKKPKETTNA